MHENRVLMVTIMANLSPFSWLEWMRELQKTHLEQVVSLRRHLPMMMVVVAVGQKYLLEEEGAAPHHPKPAEAAEVPSHCFLPAGVEVEQSHYQTEEVEVVPNR